MALTREFPQGQKPAWLIIFMDMMTLLLTFFVVLVSMSVIDERSRARVVESVQGVFGVADTTFNYEAPDNAPGAASGAQSTRPEDRRQEARQLLFADNQHLTLRHTRGATIIEISGDMLFEAGSATVSKEGREALDRLVPFLVNRRTPATIAGHGTVGYAEGVKTTLSGERLADHSWALSMDRALAVYRHFTSRGVNGRLLNVESFGSHRPVYDNSTPEGRRRNRRVDLVLERSGQAPGLDLRRQSGQGEDSYIFRDFEFDLDIRPPFERGNR